MSTANGTTTLFRSIGFLGLIGGFALLVSGCVVYEDDSSSVTIFNDSDYVLLEINIVSSYSDTWGADYLGPDVLYPGESLTVDFIDCGTYDMRIVDDTGVECTFYDYELCWDEDVWTITNRMLDRCAFD